MFMRIKKAPHAIWRKSSRSFSFPSLSQSTTLNQAKERIASSCFLVPLEVHRFFEALSRDLACLSMYQRLQVKQ